MSRQFGAAGLAGYLAGWVCLAPVLVLCTCVQGHAAYALPGHDEPACGQHDHGTTSDTHHDSPEHDHEDQRVPFDDFVTSPSVAALVFVPVCLGVLDALPAEARSLAQWRRAHPALGPPNPLRAAIASTILLI